MLILLMLHNNVGYINSSNNLFGKDGNIILRLIGFTGKLAKPVLILQGQMCSNRKSAKSRF